ncbi:ferritin [Desulfurococcus amylolyticus]|uniref:Ferritin, Dps family protein n=1 Tax=Desulfurococcus amylolyticus (strain DSM 18924 / JCM 16383 / VKM B-2413 / 1221n) TaxID=490899 RepID=B8D305_DESA1|nr:ferritin [Desulfurococcus amylolyticus]ACL10552.1 ferritin, Dps family protein [Desulfurococcus amylolyticus 1221n]
MHPELIEALNKQLNQELRNAYLYFSMASFLDYKGLHGFSHFFKIQAKEELEHALKIYQFINDRGDMVVLQGIDAPRREWRDIVELASDFYNAERENTERIWRLMDLARRHGDKACEVFLEWFINEQVEEEKNALELLGKVKMIGDNIGALLMLDRVLAERK